MLFKSLKKSKIMKQAEQAMQKPLDFNNMFLTQESEKTVAFKELYSVMKSMNGFQGIIETTDASELYSLASRISCVRDYNGKGDYLPVALISFPNTLAIILRNKETILY